VSPARVWAIGLAAVTACSGGTGTQGPVDLRFASGSAPVTYRTVYQQSIEWGEALVVRTYRVRYVMAAGVGPAAPGPMDVVLDSMGVTVSTPHGQQTLDTRHMIGTEFTITLPQRGGTPTYTDEPVFEMPGVLEQRVTLSRLMDYGFPHLPDHPVNVGDTWSATWSRPQIEVQLTMPAELTTEYTLTGWETVDGVDCVRIVGRVTGAMSSRTERSEGPAIKYAGTLEGELTWLFDPVAGRVLRVSGEESSDGVLTSGAADTAIRQTTTIEIHGTREVS